MPAKKKKLMTKVKSFRDLRERAEKDERYAKLCVVALSNLGCEHLARGRDVDPDWVKSLNGLYDYVGALVGEYGESEDSAEKNVLGEINFVRDCVN